MKKTFRKVIASMLAVLMVICAMPFTAFAAEVGRQWWIDDGVDPATITGEPEFGGLVEAGWDWFDFGASMDISGTSGADDSVDDVRDSYKPVLGVITTSMGSADMDWSTLANDYFQKCYGYNASCDYDAMVAKNKVVNPADLKAGQRIAVSIEVGGFDMVSGIQIKGTFETDYLMPSRYTAKPAANRPDPWAAVTTTAQGWLCNGATFTTNCIGWSGAKCDKTTGDFYIYGTGQSGLNGLALASNYIGSIANGDRNFGKYGIFAGTMVFEVLQDCDLSEVFHFTEHDFGATPKEEGTFVQPLAYEECDDGVSYIGTAAKDDVFAVMPIVWDNYSAGGEEKCTHDNTKTVNAVDATCLAAGYTGDVVCADCGETVTAGTEIPKLDHSYTGTLTKVTDKTHSIACVNGCTTTKTVDCTFEVEHTKLPAIGVEGLDTYTCACGNSYTQKVDAVTCLHEGTKTTDTNVTKEASCTELGSKTITVTCDVCGNVIETKTEDIPMTAHVAAAEKANVKTATCTAEGYTGDVVCKDCGAVITEGETVAMAAHTPGAPVEEETTAPTCTAVGQKTITTSCTVCDNVIETKTEDIPMTAHVAAAELANVKEATCTAEGYTGDVVCKDCGAVITEGETVAMAAHTPGAPVVTTVEPTLETEGSVTTTVSCTVCDAEISKNVDKLPVLPGYDITVVGQDLGTVTLNGVDVTEGATIKVPAGSEIKLVATATQGSEFLGWIANGATTVSTDAEHTASAQANIVYTPVFAAVEDGSFIVTFVDAYGNILSTQTVANGADVEIPAVPDRVGYTDAAWSLTDEDIAALTADATIMAQYTKDEANLFTVTADTCDITVSGNTVSDVATDIAYDTQVTVTKEGATAWTIDGVTVAYGDTYTFYVGSDVTVVPTFDAVTATPAVANVKVTRVGAAGAEQFVFLATRSLEGFEFVNAGFVYGKGELGNIELADVDGTAIKAAYCKTTSDQFSLTYGLRSQSGEITARAFLIFVDGNGNTQVIYADTQTVSY